MRRILPFCATRGNDKVIECPTLMQSTIHLYEARERNLHLVDVATTSLSFSFRRTLRH